MKPIVKLFVGIIVVIAMICGIFLYYNYYTSISLLHFILFASMILFTNNITYISSSSKDINIGMILPVAFIIMDIYGPFWAAIISSFGTITLKHRKEHYTYKFIFNAAMLSITAAASALTYQYLVFNLDIEGVLIPFALASLVYYIVNNSLVLSVVRMSSSTNNIKREDSLFIVNLLANLVISYFIGLLLWYSFKYYNVFVMLLIVIFVYIIRHFIYANLHKLKIQKDLQKSNQELEYTKLKNTFFRNLSHEFKTPLNLIFSSIQLMEK